MVHPPVVQAKDVDEKDDVGKGEIEEVLVLFPVNEQGNKKEGIKQAQSF